VGGAAGTGGGTRVTACTGPWPDPYRHALRVTPAAHCPPARPLPRRRTSQPDPTGPVCLSYTLRPSLGGCHPCNRSVPKPQLEYGSLTMGLVWRWSVHDIWPIVSGPVFMRKTRRGRDLEILARRSGPSTGDSLPPTGQPGPPSGGSPPGRRPRVNMGPPTMGRWGWAARSLFIWENLFLNMVLNP
jgi:hypothetical protein